MGNVSPEKLSAGEQEFTDALLKQSIDPPSADPHIGAFAEAFHELSQQGFAREYFRPLHNRNLSGPYSANLVLRAMQKQLLPRRYYSYMLEKYPSTNTDIESMISRPSVADKFTGESEYPHGFDDRQKWRYAFEFMIADRDASSDFYYDLAARKVQSNISERYKGLKLALFAYKDRFGESPRVLDVGCSQNLGLKQLSLSATDENYTFLPPQAGHEIRRTDDGQELIVDDDLTARINDGLSDGPAIGHSLGVDLFSVKDFLIEQWIRSCSFRPSELLDQARLDRFNMLCSSDPNNINFAQTDFASEDPWFRPIDTAQRLATEWDINKALAAKFDVVSFFTILHQLRTDEAARMFENARHYLKPDGIMVVQDFYSSVNEPYDAVIAHDIYEAPFIYRTLIVDMADPKPRGKYMPKSGFQEFLVWNDGRCNSVCLGAGKAALKLVK